MGEAKRKIYKKTLLVECIAFIFFFLLLFTICDMSHLYGDISRAAQSIEGEGEKKKRKYKTCPRIFSSSRKLFLRIASKSDRQSPFLRQYVCIYCAAIHVEDVDLLFQ